MVYLRYDEYREGRYLEPLLHRNALKHLSREEVLLAWESVVERIQRVSTDEPPRWLMIGWLPDGRGVELIAVETTKGWLIIHAKSPIEPKFAKEIENTKRRIR